jgi:hypothetical protein
MTEPKWTPGPWRSAAEAEKNYLWSLHIRADRSPRDDDDDRLTVDVAWICCRDDGAQDAPAAPGLERAKANARLIAAAPDLDNGCGALLGLIDLILNHAALTPVLRDVLTNNHRIAEARAARAKARGE